MYGTEATGKSAIVQGVLDALASPSGYPTSNGLRKDSTEETLQFTIVKSTECITWRHLLEKTVNSVAEAVAFEGAVGRRDSLAQFVIELGRVLNYAEPNATNHGKGRFVLVFDGIDKQREPPPTLMPALARLGELVSRSILKLFS